MFKRLVKNDSGAINFVKIFFIGGGVAILYFTYIYLPPAIDQIGVRKAVNRGCNVAYTLRHVKDVKDAIISDFKELKMEDETINAEGAVVKTPTNFHEENIAVDLVENPASVTVEINYERKIVWPFLKKEKVIAYTYSHTTDLSPTKY